MIINLKNRALIKVSGKDAEKFLQSQFSNDIKKIQEDKIQINAYCQHQGKIIAILLIFKKNKNYYLSIPDELLSLVFSKLTMFKMMSSVEIKDVSEKVHQYGLINENIDKSYQINKNLSLLTSTELITDCQNNSQWELACINESLPEIYFGISEKHIPQALNLDINEIGVSFTKGCYPGQEVVARMHYLGEPKRRLYRFTSKFEVFIGDNLNVNNSKSLKSSGQVIRVANDGYEFYFLAVFEVSHIHEQIFLNNDQKKLVNLIHE